MNEEVYFEYLSQNLHTFIHIYHSDFSPITTYCNIPDFTDYLLENSKVKSFLLNQAYHEDPTFTYKCPILRTINNQFFYALVADKNNDRFFLLGPVRFTNKFLIQENLENIEFPHLWDQSVSILEPLQALDLLCFCHNFFGTNTITNQDIALNMMFSHDANKNALKKYSEILFENNETLSKHNPYDQERREQTAIEYGDIEQFEKSIAEDYVGNLGVLSKDKLRHMKNLAIVVISLASRSAIRGGLSPELSFTLSDSFIQQIEELSSTPDILSLTRSAELQYTQMVHEIRIRNTAKKEKNPRIEKCKDYIFSHLHDKITVELLAEQVDCNPNYLSQLFKKCEGESLSHYILSEKINRAKNLLVYSDYSYIDIANYLGFASQSHLGQQFKSMTGYTLRSFRQKFGQQE